MILSGVDDVISVVPIFTHAAAGAAGGDFAVTAEDDVRHVQDRHRLHGAEGSAVG